MTKTQRPKLSRAQLLTRLKEMNDELAQSNAREGERIGRLAVEAGLADLELSDHELLTGFGKLRELAIAGEFKSSAAKPLPSPRRAQAPPPSASQTGGQRSAA